MGRFATTLSISERLKTAGLQFLDAPVSSMRKRAEAGTLTMMIGRCAEQAARLKEPLSSMAAEILGRSRRQRQRHHDSNPSNPR